MQQVVIITGASQGIGAASARRFADAGWRVAALARNGQRLAEVVEEIGTDRAMALVCDVSDPMAMQEAVRAVEQRWGRVDALVNNAGVIEPMARLENADPAAFAQAMAININGVFNGIHAVLPLMRRQGRGSIVTVSSGAAHRPVDAWGAYCASKAAVAMLMKVLHLEEGARGIRCLSMSPGTVATQMQDKIRASGVNDLARRDPALDISADLAARGLLWLCQPEADAWLGQEVSLRDPAILAEIKRLIP